MNQGTNLVTSQRVQEETLVKREGSSIEKEVEEFEHRLTKALMAEDSSGVPTWPRDFHYSFSNEAIERIQTPSKEFLMTTKKLEEEQYDKLAKSIESLKQEILTLEALKQKEDAQASALQFEDTGVNWTAKYIQKLQ